MGSLCTATPQQSTSTNAPPQWLQQAYQNLMGQAANVVSSNPFTPYGGEFTAGMDPTQLAAMNNTGYVPAGVQPYLNQATNLYGQGAGMVNQGASYIPQAANMVQGGSQYINQGAGLVGQGSGLINQGAGIAQGALPYFNQAMNYAQQGTTPLAQLIPGLMSPYTNDVVNATQNQFTNANAQQGSALLSQGIAAGNAFGGDRAGVAEAQLANQQQLAQAPVIAGLYNTGFQTALSGAEQENAENLQAAGLANQTGQGVTGVGSAVGNLGAQQVGAGTSLGQLGLGEGTLGSEYGNLGLGLANAGTGLANIGNAYANTGNIAGTTALNAYGQMFNQGTQQQATQQAQDTALYNQFLMQQGYPFQTTGWEGNLFSQLGSGLGSTTTGSVTPSTNPLSTITGGVTSLVGLGLLASDKRVKENKKIIGHTHKGMPIYRFNYKGDPSKTQQLGLMAQDVEQDHPEAVHTIGGVKHVDYGKATGKAAGGGTINPFDPSTFVGNLAGYVPQLQQARTARALTAPQAPGLLSTNTGQSSNPLGGIESLIKASKKGGLGGSGGIGGLPSEDLDASSIGMSSTGYDEGGAVDDLAGLYGDDDNNATDYLTLRNALAGENAADQAAEAMVLPRHFADGGSPDDDDTSTADYFTPEQVSALGLSPQDVATSNAHKPAGLPVDMPPEAIAAPAEKTAPSGGLNMTARLETGNAGSDNISNDTAGSRSYGRLGLNSRSGSASQFASMYPDLGLTARPGSREFDSQWHQAVKDNPEGVQAAEADWHQRNVVAPVQQGMASVNPNLAADQRVLNFLADRRVQMGGLGWDRAVQAAQQTNDPVQFIRSVSGMDLQHVGGDFQTYLSQFPQNVHGLINRINNRAEMSLAGDSQTTSDDMSRQPVRVASNDPVAGIGQATGVSHQPMTQATVARAIQTPGPAGETARAGLGALQGGNRSLGLALLAASAQLMANPTGNFGSNLGAGLAAGVRTYESAEALQNHAKQLQQQFNRQNEQSALATRRADTADRRADQADTRETAREKETADREERLARQRQIPQNYESDPANPGSVRPIKGSPSDPVVISTQAEAKRDKSSDLDADTIKPMVEEYLAGNERVMSNMGRGASASHNIGLFRTELAKEMQRRGMSGEDQARAMANFAGQQAAIESASVRASQIETSVNEALQTFPMALDASRNVPRTTFVPINQALEMVRKGTGSPEMSRFVAANQAAVTAYAQAMSRTGATSVHAQDAAERILNTANSPEAYAAALDQLQKEMGAARVSPDETRRAILGRIGQKKDDVGDKDLFPASGSGGTSAVPKDQNKSSAYPSDIPKGVPAGSLYNPGRKQWKSPDGKHLYDASGNEIS